MITRKIFACQNGHMSKYISFSFTLLRELLSFENWRRGQKKFLVGVLLPAPPLATAL